MIAGGVRSVVVSEEEGNDILPSCEIWTGTSRCLIRQVGIHIKLPWCFNIATLSLSALRAIHITYLDCALE